MQFTAVLAGSLLAAAVHAQNAVTVNTFALTFCEGASDTVSFNPGVCTSISGNSLTGFEGPINGCFLQTFPQANCQGGLQSNIGPINANSQISCITTVNPSTGQFQSFGSLLLAC